MYDDNWDIIGFLEYNIIIVIGDVKETLRFFRLLIIGLYLDNI